MKSIVSTAVKITGQDRFVLYRGLTEESFNRVYTAVWNAYRNPVFSKSSPAIRALGPSSSKLAKEVHDEERKRVKARDGLPRKLTPVDLVKEGFAVGSWEHDAATWWNLFLATPYTTKSCQLYLWGPSNVGKTHFVEHVLLSKCLPPSLSLILCSSTIMSGYLLQNGPRRAKRQDQRPYQATVSTSQASAAPSSVGQATTRLSICASCSTSSTSSTSTATI